MKPIVIEPFIKPGSTLEPADELAAKRTRLSRAVALVVLSPAVLALSGCSSNCDSTRSTPQTSDDCGTGSRGGGYYGGRYHGSGSQASGSTRGGFGGFGRMFGGFGS